MNKREFKVLISQIKQQLVHAEQAKQRSLIRSHALRIAAISNARNLYFDLVAPSKSGSELWPTIEHWFEACNIPAQHSFDNLQ